MNGQMTSQMIDSVASARRREESDPVDTTRTRAQHNVLKREKTTMGIDVNGQMPDSSEERRRDLYRL